jgi:ubiquinone biosynthesis protein UbiJ
MLTATLENILNRGLPRSPRARALCSELAGQQLAVEMRGVGEFLVESDGNALRITTGNATSAHVRISGGPLGLLRFAAAPEGSAERADVQVSGDAELAAKFRELLRLLQPDFEEELALAIGDVPAHQLARLARASFGWLRGAGDTALRNVAEFFAHERGDLVSRAEGRQFLSGVDALREHVDRLEARIEWLAQRGGARRPEPPAA